MAKVTTFEVGYCTHVGCMALRGAGFRVCKFPARAYLLEVGDKRWLWDTGYSYHFSEQTRNGVFRLYSAVTPVYFDPQEALVEQLRSQGLDAKDIDGLILSHFHGDHIAGLRDFDDLAYICSGEGWQKISHLRGVAALKCAFVPGLIPSDFESRVSFIESYDTFPLPAELAPFTQGYLLPESKGEIILVPLPGHAAGHIGAFIQTDEGWTLLASDAAWSPANYKELRGPSRLANFLMDDPKLYYQTLRNLNQLYKNGVSIKLCHEGDL